MQLPVEAILEVGGIESLLSQESLAEPEQHVREVHLVGHAAIGAGEESGRKCAAQPAFGVEGDSKGLLNALLLVEPDKTERHLLGAAVQQQNAFLSVSSPRRTGTRNFRSAKRHIGDCAHAVRLAVTPDYCLLFRGKARILAPLPQREESPVSPERPAWIGGHVTEP